MAMRHCFNRAADFIYIIEAFPGGIPKLRQYLLNWGIFIPESVRWGGRVWDMMVEAKGEDRAADILAEIIVSQLGDRMRGLVIAQADEDSFVQLRADDPDLAHVLFEHEELNNDLGWFVADYWERSRGPNAEPGSQRTSPPVQPESPPPDISQLQAEIDELRSQVCELSTDLDDSLTGNVADYRPSAEINSGLGFERVVLNQRALVTADPTWLEEDLENFLWNNWEKIDFGVEGPLVLFGRQMRIDEGSLDRVDILAKGPRGTWYAIELKIVEATRKDVAQLESYVSQLVQRGVPQEKARGFLVAPAFSSKVVNIAAIRPELELLRFRLPSR